jgi:CBS domain-containing protein
MGTFIDRRTFETDPLREEADREVPLREGFLTIPVRDLIARQPVTMAPSATVGQAVAVMNREGFGAILVVEHERLVGIFTERDVLRKIAGRKLDFDVITLAQYMTRDVETLGPDAQVAYALNMMVIGGYRHVPIVDGRDRPIGLVSVRDIVEQITLAYPKDTLNLPIDPRLEMRNLDGG